MHMKTTEISFAPGYFINREGEVFNSRGKKLKPVLRNGYLRLGLYVNKRRKFFTIHNLLVKVFNKAENYEVCRHLDGNRKNNKLSNLKPGTYKENSKDMLEHGTRLRGSKHPNRKITDKDVLDIRAMAANDYYSHEIAEIYALSPGNVRCILNGRRWGHLPGAIRRKSGPRKAS